MKFYWHIAFASALSTLAVSPIHAVESSRKEEKSQDTQRRAQQVTEADVSDPGRRSVGSSGENFKWTIPSLENPAVLNTSASKTEPGKKSTSYFSKFSPFSLALVPYCEVNRQ